MGSHIIVLLPCRYSTYIMTVLCKILCRSFTESMESSPWEVDRHFDSQAVPCL